MSGLITFSSDYGPTDEFVGVCRLVIARIAPGVRVIDVAHGIRGLRAGSAVLAQSLGSSPAAVHLAVVDPGVGTDRRAVVVVCGGGSLLVGPDNGLFFPVADVLGGAAAAFELTEETYRAGTSSSTFHGRDIFAPAAAHLASGVRAEEFGPPVATGDLVRLPPPLVRAEPGRLDAEILRTDWFGNIQLAATARDLHDARLDGRVRVNTVDATIGEKFADVAEGELLVYVNSAGHVAIACNRGSAWERLHGPVVVTVTR